MARYLTAAALLLFFSSTVAAAEKATLEEILAALGKGYASMEDLQANFSQKTYIATLKREEKGAGELFLKKKGGGAQFRFNYTKPKQQIISNGKNVWYYLPDNRQVIITDSAKLFAGGNGIALSYLTGLGKIADDFTIRLLTNIPDKKGNYSLELVPKQNTAAVAKLHLVITAEALEKSRRSVPDAAFFPIAASVLFDHTGNRTTIEFSKVRVNSSVAAERFTFKPPAGIEVIQQ